MEQTTQKNYEKPKIVKTQLLDLPIKPCILKLIQMRSAVDKIARDISVSSKTKNAVTKHFNACKAASQGLGVTV